MRNFLFLFIIVLKLNLSVSAQIKDTLTLIGTLSVQNGEDYKYKLVVFNKNGNWNGYSILDENGTNETKSTVTMQILKQKSAIAFAEKGLISTKSAEKNFCYVGGVLKINNAKTQAKGVFIGQDEKKKICGNGTIKLSLPPNLRQILTEIKTTPDTAPKTSIITSHNAEHILTNQDQIQLEVWDGGLEDNDSISIRLNNQLIEPGLSISREKKQFNIKLQKGENIISITALNEGTEPPNSARFSIITEEKRHPIVSFLRKGESAQIKIKVKP